MKIQRGKLSDLDAIMAIYASAREFMRESGNPNQWEEGYPSREMTMEGIESGRLYTVTGDDGIIHGTFYMAVEDDPTYQKIENGNWLYDEPYAVIHRIAQDGRLHGMLPFVLDYTVQCSRYIRIDTHEENLVMRRLLAKNGFRESGIVYVRGNSPRIAYERKS